MFSCAIFDHDGKDPCAWRSEQQQLSRQKSGKGHAVDVLQSRFNMRLQIDNIDQQPPTKDTSNLMTITDEQVRTLSKLCRPSDISSSFPSTWKTKTFPELCPLTAQDFIGSSFMMPSIWVKEFTIYIFTDFYPKWSSHCGNPEHLSHLSAFLSWPGYCEAWSIRKLVNKHTLVITWPKSGPMGGQWHNKPEAAGSDR